MLDDFRRRCGGLLKAVGFAFRDANVLKPYTLRGFLGLTLRGCPALAVLRHFSEEFTRADLGADLALGELDFGFAVVDIP